MSETMGLLELAERCEASTEARRTLDALIACETDWPPLGPMISHWVNEEALEPDKREGYVRLANHPDSPATWEVPEYTNSVDAAMTLVPNGWGWLVSQPNEKALASGLLKELTPVLGEVQFGCDHRFAVACATPALALIAASLRARHALALSKGSDV